MFFDLDGDFYDCNDCSELLIISSFDTKNNNWIEGLEQLIFGQSEGMFGLDLCRSNLRLGQIISDQVL